MKKICVIYTTLPTATKAKTIAKKLLALKLIKCASIHKINSIYNWENKLKDETECALTLKLSSKNSEKIIKELTRIHPYKTPCILKFQPTANNEYASWINL